MKRSFIVISVVFLLSFLFSSLLYAQVELYDEVGLSPYRETMGSSEFEHIDTFNRNDENFKIIKGGNMYPGISDNKIRGTNLDSVEEASIVCNRKK